MRCVNIFKLELSRISQGGGGVDKHSFAHSEKKKKWNSGLIFEFNTIEIQCHLNFRQVAVIYTIPRLDAANYFHIGSRERRYITFCKLRYFLTKYDLYVGNIFFINH